MIFAVVKRTQKFKDPWWIVSALGWLCRLVFSWRFIQQAG